MKYRGRSHVVTGGCIAAVILASSIGTSPAAGQPPATQKSASPPTASTPAAKLPPTPGAATQARVATDKVFDKWTGDLDGMIKRRFIRAIVAYNKTHFFVDKGVQRGITHDALKQFETELNARLKTGPLGVSVVFLPMSRDKMQQALLDGLGDIVAANITVTPERQAVVAFTEPGVTNVQEIVVTAPGAPTFASVDDLSGQEVFVRQPSVYADSLTTLNATLVRQGRKPVTIKAAPPTLEDEDILEMVNAGLVKITVVDDHLARFWKQIFTGLTLHPAIVVRSAGAIAMAVRKDSPRLKTELDSFIKANRVGTVFGNVTMQKYLRSTKFAKSATSEAEFQRFQQTVEMFRKYGDQYDLDYLLMAAQGFQESGLDQNAKSRVGAVGVMQVMPATAKQLNVGDVARIDSNIHAGVKYIRFMIDQYYAKEPMDRVNKGLFAFAAYNAGPGRIRQLRREAQARGLDPNVWFNNVERIASERIGRETVTYVSNIFKYYVAYRLASEQIEARKPKKLPS